MTTQGIKNLESSGNNICAARIHKYGFPLEVDDIQKPTISSPEQVIVRVGASGLCHSDLHLINGDWQKSLPISLPKTPGHEVAGWVEETGASVPKNSIKEGDLVAVFGGWGCGYCIYCKRGDEQMCQSARWPGLSEYDGGFSEYLLVPSYKFLVRVDKGATSLKPEEIAPLTDAGLTPYRAIKKVRQFLGPNKNIAIIGIGGLGFYGIQYAQILGSGANILAMDRREDKLELAKQVGADFTLNIATSEDIRNKIEIMTKGQGIDVVLDTVGLESTLNTAVNILNKNGAMVVVGLFGREIKAPLFQTVIKEFQIYGSLWGNYNELCEVIELAKNKKIKHHIRKFSLSKVNDAIDLLRTGSISGRAVIIP
ncbi:MAG TPA: NAD(P)-dependent alcohol dehydrogenase [Nitrososphaeraceae archaeon]|jgi:propanol-preferring alcohol dehydrogenase